MKPSCTSSPEPSTHRCSEHARCVPGCAAEGGQRADCKSGLNYTPSANSSLREFRIGSCEKPPVTQTTKPKFLQEDLVAPQVEQTVDLDQPRPSQLCFTSDGRVKAGAPFMRSLQIRRRSSRAT